MPAAYHGIASSGAAPPSAGTVVVGVTGAAPASAAGATGAPASPGAGGALVGSFGVVSGIFDQSVFGGGSAVVACAGSSSVPSHSATPAMSASPRPTAPPASAQFLWSSLASSQ